MPRIPHFSLMVASLFFSSGLSAGEVASSPAHPWGDLVGHSPFGGALSSGSGSRPAGLEFRGLVCDLDGVWVNLYDPVSRKAEWCAVPGSPRGDLTLESYDPVTDHLVIVSAGRRLDLAFQRGHVSLPVQIAPLAVPEVLEPAGPGENERDAFVRQLPPDARQLLEQAKRRRSPRVPEADASALTQHLADTGRR